MKLVAIALFVCASCTTRVNGFFEREIDGVHDPEARADLRAVGDAKACREDSGALNDCSSANDNRSRGLAYSSYASSLTPPARIAACIVTVASYQPPTRDQFALRLRAYEPFKDDLHDRAPDLCTPCVPDDDAQTPAALLTIRDKYLARCSAHADDELSQTLEAELAIDLGAVRAARDDDNPTFGEKLGYVEAKVARIHGLGRDPAFVVRSRADLQELRFGVYGPTAMRSAFDHDATVVPARKELETVDAELARLSHSTTEADVARVRALGVRSDELRAAIASEEAKYSFAASDARVKAYESLPETMQIKQRLSALKAELLRAGESHDIARSDALVAEQKQLDAQLETARKQLGITWPVY